MLWFRLHVSLPLTTVWTIKACSEADKQTWAHLHRQRHELYIPIVSCILYFITHTISQLFHNYFLSAPKAPSYFFFFFCYERWRNQYEIMHKYIKHFHHILLFHRLFRTGFFIRSWPYTLLETLYCIYCIYKYNIFYIILIPCDHD